MFHGLRLCFSREYSDEEKDEVRSEYDLNDWKEKTLDQWKLINTLSLKRFGDRPLAEQAALAVMERLLENDGLRVKSYGGKAPFAAYIGAISWRLLEDFSRSKFGRRRPPQWIRNLGGIWLQLYRLLCLERIEIREAVELIDQAEAAASTADIDAAAWRIRQEVVDCGSHQALEVEEGPAYGASPSGSDQVAQVENEQKEELFRLLFSVLTDTGDELVEADLGKLSGVSMALKPEEKLMLKLIYQDDVGVSRAAAMLGYNRDQMNGRLRRLLDRIRARFEQADLHRELIELLR